MKPKSSSSISKRHRTYTYRSTVASSFCPTDPHGPRIPTLLRQFAIQCPVKSHLQWLQLLHASCESQPCLVTNCKTRTHFAQTHGAKSLINSITMFLTYYVSNKLLLQSDHQWRQILAALYTFHNYCVRKRYIKHDHVLVTALYTLRNFRICTIPQRIAQLANANYWTSLESPSSNQPHHPASPVDTPDSLTHLNNNTHIAAPNRSTSKEPATTVHTPPQLEHQPKTSHLSSHSPEQTLHRTPSQSSKLSIPSTSNPTKLEPTSPKYDDDQTDYDAFIGDGTPLIVKQVMDDGWLMHSEDSDIDAPHKTVFLHLPSDFAQMGMQGMSLSCLHLALRNDIWRPVLRDDAYVTNAYPPDDIFYY